MTRARTRMLVLACWLAAAAPAWSQTTMLASAPSGTRDTLPGGWIRAASSAAVALRHTVSLRLAHVTLKDALDTLGRVSGLEVAYGAPVLRSSFRVSLRVDGMTVAEALDAMLIGTGLNAYISLSGRAVLVLSADALISHTVMARARGAVQGHVTDAVSHAPVDRVVVHLEGTALGAVSGADGAYAIRNIPAGAYQVVARRLGYTPVTKALAIVADSTSTLDFAVAPAPTKLSEIVTTAVGDQRRYEVGNVISTINVDSLTPTAPVTSLTDVLSARAPGVNIQEQSGRAGGGESIRIRGVSSLVLQSDPIVIVDGVRQDNTPGGTITNINGTCSYCSSSAVPGPTRLNDIDFNDVESIDVLKGPAASTEYGTDAANGVIVIKTKHGRSGGPQWHASAEQSESAIPEPFPQLYHAWGHTTDGLHTPVLCPVVGYAYNQEGGHSLADGTCAQDSVTSWDPLNHSYYSMFGTGSRGKYDLSVTGGSDLIRYYGSAGLTNEAGIERMPQAFYSKAAAIGFPNSLYNPNSENQRSIRGNASAVLSASADLSANGAYLSTYQNGPLYQADYEGVVSAAGVKDSTFGYPSYFSPPSLFGQPVSSQTDRFTGGLTAGWHPASWFTTHATVGIDHGSGRIQSEVLPQIAAYVGGPSYTGLSVENLMTDIYSADLRASATALPLRALRAVTSAGLQLVDDRTQGSSALVQNITVENQTLNGAPNPYVTQIDNRRATLGGYLEEELGVADRLFLTGAVRVDAGSGFGRSYNTAVYPKASVSWLALTNGPATVRVRGAYGQSGQQPPNGAALQLFSPQLVWINGAPVSTVGIANAANAQLQPERSAEFEGGLDIGLWQNRATIDFTAYQKTTDKALVATGTGFDLGALPYYENIGKVRNSGVELAVSATPVQAQLVTWDVSVNASINHNTLVSLAPGVLAQTPITIGAYKAIRFVPGYPLYGNWGITTPYADLNHDGIIEPNEVTFNKTLTYAGSTSPTREFSLGTHLAVLRGAVAIGALVDYRGGFTLENNDLLYEALDYQTDPASVNRHASLAKQALDVALEQGEVNGSAFSYGRSVGLFEDASYIRFRELSLTYTIPQRLTRRFRVQNLSVTGAVRNLALWTPFGGIDPEVAGVSGLSAQYQASSNAYVYNHDLRMGREELPLSRYWVVRLNVGF